MHSRMASACASSRTTTTRATPRRRRAASFGRLSVFFLALALADGRDAEVQRILDLAAALKLMREADLSPRCFDSGLAVSLFRDQSTRTRFSFSGACNLLGLAVQDFD